MALDSVTDLGFGNLRGYVCDDLERHIGRTIKVLGVSSEMFLFEHLVSTIAYGDQDIFGS